MHSAAAGVEAVLLGTVGAFQEPLFQQLLQHLVNPHPPLLEL